MTPTLPQILIIVAVIVVLILAMRWIQPKLTPGEKYLLHVIQRKSPQSDNIRLFMWLKMVIHPVNQFSDLEYQDSYLNDPEKYKQLAEQFHYFGPNALYPLLGYEALTWHLDVNTPDPLIVRLAANQVCRRYPHTAVVVEDLLIQSPDAVTTHYLKKDPAGYESIQTYQARYKILLSEILKTIATTSRNDWWPGSSPDIREWAESLLTKIAAKDQDSTKIDSKIE